MWHSCYAISSLAFDSSLPQSGLDPPSLSYFRWNRICRAEQCCLELPYNLVDSFNPRLNLDKSVSDLDRNVVCKIRDVARLAGRSAHGNALPGRQSVILPPLVDEIETESPQSSCLSRCMPIDAALRWFRRPCLRQLESGSSIWWAGHVWRSSGASPRVSTRRRTRDYPAHLRKMPLPNDCPCLWAEKGGLGEDNYQDGPPGRSGHRRRFH